MSLVTINVSIDTANKVQVDLLYSFLKNLDNPMAVVETPAPPASRKTKATETVKAEEPVKVVEPIQAEEPVKAEESEIKVETVRALLAKKVGDHREEIKSKLTAMGANNVTSLDKSKFPEFMEFLNGLG